MMALIHLTPNEIQLGEALHLALAADSKKRGLKNVRGLNGDGEFEGYWGALGEIAFCSAIGTDPHALFLHIGTHSKYPDVEKWDVRTGTKHNYRLLIHESDPDDRDYVLVTVAPMFKKHKCSPKTDFLIHGYYRGGEAKKHSEWYTNLGKEDRQWVWAVPQKHLKGGRI